MPVQPNNYNHCLFMGRLVSDVDVKTLNSANGPFKKAFFTLAVDKNLGSKQRKEAEQAGKPTCDFIDFEVTGDGTIEYVQNWYNKGKPAVVSAQYNKWSYKDANGQTAYAHNFKVVSIQFSINDTTRNNGNNNSGSSNSSPSMNPPQSQPQNNFNMFDSSGNSEPF